MTPILVDCPWVGGSTDLLLPGGLTLRDPAGRSLRSARNQVIVWCALVRPGLRPPTGSIGRFAAIVDSGFGDTMLIRQEQLEHWCLRSLQLAPPLLDARGMQVNVQVGATPVPKFQLDLWTFPNLAGHRDRPDPLAAPVQFRLQSGVLVWPSHTPGGDRFRLPLLGMQGLREIGAHLEIDALRGVANMSV